VKFSSENLASQQLTFERFDVQHIVRAALIEGLKPENEEHEVYFELVMDYSGQPTGKVVGLYNLLREQNLTDGRRKELDDLLADFAPRSETSNWRNFDYRRLVDAKVIVRISDNLDGILQKAVENRKYQVLAISNPIAEIGTDYDHHIPRRNKIILDSEESIAAFAASTGMSLHPHWDGHVNDDLIKRLRGQRYTINEGVTTALTQRQGSTEKHCVISFTNYSSKDEVRIYPLDMVKHVEMFLYFKSHNGAAATFELGDAGPLYAGTKTLLVAKRFPDG